MQDIKTILIGLFGCTLVTWLTSCGVGPKEKDARTSAAADSNPDLDIPISIQASGAAFALTSASSFTMSLEGCASGFSIPTITEAAPNLTVFKQDTGCLVKLNRFDSSGVTWIPSSSDPFSSYASGDTATFENSTDPSQVVRVIVVNQISSPSQPGDSIAYTFSNIGVGASKTIAESITSNSHAISVDELDAPNFFVSGVQFMGIAAGGAGQFVFTMECLAPLSGTGLASICDGVSLGQIKYKLIQDIYSGSLTIDQATSIFNGGGTSIDSGEVLAAGSGGTVDGGFTTQTLVGPAVMQQNPEMILLLEAGGVSYQYFNVDVATLSYP